MTDRDPGGIFADLAQPCDIKWRLKSVTPKGAKPPYPAGTRGQFLAYIDARDVFNKLDSTLGPPNWQSEVRAVNGDGSVIVRLSIRVDDEWIVREDIGYSNNPGSEHEEEPLKAAVSDGVKRAAVHYGIGRFLYEMPAKWEELTERGEPKRPLPGAPTAANSQRKANLDSMASSLATIATNSGMPPDEAVTMLEHSLGVSVDRATGEVTAPESPRDIAARTLWNEAQKRQFTKPMLNAYCISLTNHTLEKADTQMLIKVRNALIQEQDLDGLKDRLTNVPGGQQEPEQPTTPNPETPSDQPCAIEGCTGSCKGEFINFSLRRYGVPLCAKHSKMAKNGEIEAELERLNTVAAR